MTLRETYREERLIDRRSRARKARIAGRIIGFGLMACLLVALRTDPQLRTMVDDLAIWVIGGGDPRQADAAGPQTAAIDALGYAPDSTEAATVEQLGIVGDANTSKPEVRQMPETTVKIHRGGIVKDD